MVYPRAMPDRFLGVGGAGRLSLFGFVESAKTALL